MATGAGVVIVYKATDHAQHDSWNQCKSLADLHNMLHGNPSRLYEVLVIIETNENGETFRYASPEEAIDEEGRRLRMITLAAEIQKTKADLAEHEAVFAELEKESK